MKSAGARARIVVDGALVDGALVVVDGARAVLDHRAERSHDARV